MKEPTSFLKGMASGLRLQSPRKLKMNVKNGGGTLQSTEG